MADVDNGPGLGAGLAGKLELTLGRVAEGLERWNRRYEAMEQSWQDVHPVPIARVSLAAAGSVVDLPDLLGPHDGLWWDVRRLSFMGTVGGGSVDVHLNDVNTEIIARVTSAPTILTWSAQVILGPRDRLVFQANASTTGPVYISGQAIEIDARVLPSYLI